MELKNEVKTRVHIVRLRTWLCTLALLMAIAFYFVVKFVTKNAINWLDFLFLTTIVFITYCVYFPDGDLYGQQDSVFKANKLSYNELAKDINEKKLLPELREYCKVDFEQRKQEYIDAVLGKLNITQEEYEVFKTKEEKEIKTIKSWKFTEDSKEVVVVLSKHKRRILHQLLFEELPIEENVPEVIMSAVDNDKYKAIKDRSEQYKLRKYLTRIFTSLIIGVVGGYVGLYPKDNFGIVEVVLMIVYLCTLIITAVTSFTAGEKTSRIYRNNFYIEAIQFFYGFVAWNDKRSLNK